MFDFYELAPSPPCRAVKMTAKLLGLEFKTHTVDLFKKEHLEEDYLKINPFHKIPAISDNGFHLSESRAIMVYLVTKYCPESPLYPKDPQKRALVDQILYTDIGTVFPAAVGVLRPQIYSGEDPPEEAVTKANEALKVLDNVLSKRTFAVGDDLTLADISLVATLSGFEMASFDLSDYPHTQKYISRIKDKLSPMYSEVNDGPIAAIKEKIKESKAKQ